MKKEWEGVTKVKSRKIKDKIIVNHEEKIEMLD